MDPKTKEKRLVGKEGEERAIECFSLFKKGIEPSWEDDANIRGGEFWMRKPIANAAVLDKWWNNLVLALVGSTVENGDEITGARVVDKSKSDGRLLM
jgi:translation initiation factor 4E